MTKRAQPKNLLPSDRLKLHLRTAKVGRRTLRVITLRPGTPVSFSTNRFHQTWHLLSGRRGAVFLSRLLWGLAYQRCPGTVVLIHGEHIRPTPFDADPSDPILLCNTELAAPTRRELEALQRQLPRWTKPERTVRWQTFGFDPDYDALKQAGLIPHWSDEQAFKSETLVRVGGFLRYAACPRMLRLTAWRLSRMQTERYAMDYHYLADYRRWPQGEVQIFDDYARQISVAEEARAAELAEGSPASPGTQAFRERVWSRCPSIRERRRDTWYLRAAGPRNEA